MNKFDSSSSSTFLTTNTEFECRYADGTFSEGFLGIDKLKVHYRFRHFLVLIFKNLKMDGFKKIKNLDDLPLIKKFFWNFI